MVAIKLELGLVGVARSARDDGTENWINLNLMVHCANVIPNSIGNPGKNINCLHKPVIDLDPQASCG